MKWLNNIKTLWGIIAVLFTALVGFIAYNQTLVHKIELLEEKVLFKIEKLDDKIHTIREFLQTAR
jgi:hypothetical protein